MKCSAQTKTPAIASKRQRKILTIAQNVRPLDMMKERKNYASLGCHDEIKESSFRCIKKDESTKFSTLKVFKQVEVLENANMCLRKV